MGMHAQSSQTEKARQYFQFIKQLEIQRPPLLNEYAYGNDYYQNIEL